MIPERIPAEIVRAYDIRGIIDESLYSRHVSYLGYALGKALQVSGHACQTVVVGQDGRLSSPQLFDALSKGLLSAGIAVVDIGLVTSPMLYFATHHLKIPHGVMITGSHNPTNYNGLKIVFGGISWYGEALQSLAEAANQVLANQSTLPNPDNNQNMLKYYSIDADYLAAVTQSVHLDKPLKVVIDCGNGTAGCIAPTLFEKLGCQVISLFSEIDGRFPNHHPDPGQPKNLTTLQETVLREKADLGLAFDGDADRVGVIDSRGHIIWPDRLLMLLAEDLLKRYPNTPVIFDVKCSQQVSAFIESKQGIPLMWKTGHSLIKAKMKETGALLAGELSGHLFFKERWYGFDDGIYAGARILEIISKHLANGSYTNSAAVFEPLPNSISTPEIALAVPESEKFNIIEDLLKKIDPLSGKISTIDGIRIDFSDGFGLIRASNTSANLILRFEGQTQAALERIQTLFRDTLKPILQQSLPF
jgi:phosphomannomutase/phosphoglucomutase